MGDGRISTSPAKFNGYITTTDDENIAINPVTNNPWWQDLGLTSTERDDWHARRQAWVILYAKYTNPAQVTSPIRGQVKNFIRDFKTFAQPLLDTMCASNKATEESEHIYHFVISKNRKQPSRRDSAITEQCFAASQSIGGAEFIIGCRTSHDTARPSLADGTDGVRMRTKVVDEPPPQGEPILVDSTWQNHTYTTARFKFDAGDENIAKWLLFVVQWWYSPNPDFKGPESQVYVVLIA